MFIDIKQNLNDKLSLTEIPTDFIRIPGQQFRKAQEQLVMSKTIWANIQTLSEYIDISYQTILLAAFKLLLFRLTAQKDLLIGISVPGQSGPDFELVKNHRTTNSILQTDLSGSPKFAELLEQVNQVSSNLFTAQDTSPAKTVSELPLENSILRVPDTSIIFCVLPDETKTLQNIKENGHISSEHKANFDIKFCLNKRSDSISFVLTYNANLYTPAHMKEFLAQYHCLLEQIIRDTGQEIMEYSLITDNAKDVLPNPSKPLQSEWKKSIPEIVTDRAQQSPDTVALVDNQNRWTYSELETRSNKLSHYLIDSGIREQDLVAVFANREASLVLAILGILKAGAAFMILDPAYPPNRLLNQLAQSQPKSFLHLEGSGSLPTELEMFCKKHPQISYLQLSNSPHSSLNDPLKRYSSKHPGVQISPESLAYVAFTSGSTGAPKGILGSHRPLAHFFTWHIETFGFTPIDRFSMLSGLAHDPILRDIFTPLCLGATLYIPAQNALLAPDKLFNWLRDNEISVIHLTPSLSQIITARPSSDSQTLPKLRYAFFGGEALTHNIVKDFYALAPNISCVNFYGATETPQAMAYYPMKNMVSVDGQERIPLGHGISNVQLLILNKNRRLAGISELGEIYIRTPYLSDGYLGDAVLTAERYLDNPFTAVPGDRLYKTGDLGRYRPDGLIDFFEREDQQIKIRGFRIELAEIEHILTQFPGIKDCHVGIREDTPNNKRIIAYFRSTEAITNQALRKFMESYLPSYMIPSAFVLLEEYPRTPNGKFDKHALLALNHNEIFDEHEYVPAQTNTEKQLTEIWKDVLNVEQIGTQDDFFDLGGHSILAVQMLIRIRDSFGLELDLSELFQKSTISDISKLIETNRQKQTESSQRPFKSLICVHADNNANLPTLFCIHGAGGNILFLREWMKYLDEFSFPLYGFQARGVDGVTKPHGSIEEMALDYIHEIQEFQPKGPYFIAGYSGGGSVALEMAEILRQKGEEVPLVILLDSYHPGIEGRRFSVGEHIQDALNNPTAFVSGKIQGMFNQVQALFHAKQLKKHIENNLPIPLELREMYINEHLSTLRQKYVTKPYDGPVALFRAANIWRVYDHIEQDLGWGKSLKNLTIKIIPGDHNDLIREPNVGILVSQIIDVVKHY